MKNLQLSLLLSVLLSLLECASAKESQSGLAHQSSIRNSLGMHMVRIPAGEFMMGSEESIQTLQADFPLMSQQRLEDLRDEAPVHRVRITRDFYMANTEVTVGQFRQFLQESGYQVESVRDGTGGYGYHPWYDPEKSVSGDQFEGRNPCYSWDNLGFPQTDQHPVVNVSLNDARALAAWLSQKEAREYRIPTEAEWEYAARAGSRTRFHSGDRPESLLGVANTFDQVAQVYWPKLAAYALLGADGFAFTAPVASFAANAFGLFDMHGNAWEWTNDFYAEDYYARSPVDDPQGPKEGKLVVRRGGSWHTWALYARSAYRNWNTPETRYILVGIRLVMNAPLTDKQ